MDSEGPWQDVVKIPTQDAFDSKELDSTEPPQMEEPKDVVKPVNDPMCLCRMVFGFRHYHFFFWLQGKIL